MTEWFEGKVALVSRAGSGIGLATAQASAGERELHLERALTTLNEELGIKRLELNGGGVTNGSFLRAGLTT